MAEASMVHLIHEAGKTAIQRDALYNVVRDYGPASPARVASAHA